MPLRLLLLSLLLFLSACSKTEPRYVPAEPGRVPQQTPPKK